VFCRKLVRNRSFVTRTTLNKRYIIAAEVRETTSRAQAYQLLKHRHGLYWPSVRVQMNLRSKPHRLRKGGRGEVRGGRCGV
jgi:hypothetical protein